MKTLNLINRYFKLLEQDDAQGQPIDTGSEPVAEPVEKPITSVAEQSYIALVAQAFAYKPPDEQVSRVNQALIQDKNYSPRAIKQLIEGYLPDRSESIQDLLSRHSNPRVIRDMVESYLPDSSESIDSLLASTDEY